MAQTTDGVNAVDADLEVSANGTTWVNISGSANQVQVPEQKRMTGTAHTFDGDLAIVSAGKREPVEVSVNGLYTEQAAELFETIRPWFQSNTRVYFRYSPKGFGATGRAVYTATNDGSTAGAVVVSAMKYPDADGTTADLIPAGFKIMVPGFIRTTTGNSTGLGSS